MRLPWDNAMPLDPSPILARYPHLIGLPLTPIRGGLINDTFALGPDHILQRLHPIFAPAVNLDILTLTAALRLRGVPVPTLLTADTGDAWVTLDADRGYSSDIAGTWRIMTRLPGRAIARVERPAQARAAAALLARFHGALIGVEHDFAFTRPGAHDTDAHMRALELALDAHPGHRLKPAVEPLAGALIGRWADLRPACVDLDLPARVVHGDPKISNLLFDDEERAVGVIDLDTMAWASVDIDVGDALRSWCNTSTEDDPTARFSAAIFAEAMAGYLDAAPWLTEAERRAFIPTTERICLELAARFAADALHERYFGWDPAAAPTRGDHNLLRAAGQLQLADDLARQRDALQAALDALQA